MINSRKKEFKWITKILKYLNKCHWLEYMEIDDNTLERKIIKEKTPKDIFNQYLKSDNYIIINSSECFFVKNFNKCLIDFKEKKIYTIINDSYGNEDYNYYKDLSDSQYKKIIEYIYNNNLLNNSNNSEMRYSIDFIEIVLRGAQKNIIKVTENNKKILNDIIDILFNDENYMLKSFNQDIKIENFNNTVNEQLKREQIISIKNDFTYKKNNAVNKSIDIYLDCLNNIENLLKKYNLKNDNRFCNAYNTIDGWISPDDAIDCLFDNVEGNVIIVPNLLQSPIVGSLGDLQINQDNYYKDGFICNTEKEMMLKQIYAIKKYLNSDKFK